MEHCPRTAHWQCPHWLPEGTVEHCACTWWAVCARTTTRLLPGRLLHVIYSDYVNTKRSGSWLLCIRFLPGRLRPVICSDHVNIKRSGSWLLCIKFSPGRLLPVICNDDWNTKGTVVVTYCTRFLPGRLLLVIYNDNWKTKWTIESMSRRLHQCTQTMHALTPWEDMTYSESL